MFLASFPEYNNVISNVFHTLQALKLSLQCVLKDFSGSICAVIQPLLAKKTSMCAKCCDISSVFIKLELMISLREIELREKLGAV